MGDRFYQTQLATIGTCPGATKTQKNRSKRRMPWTDEKKQEAIEAYLAADPTPENSIEIVQQIAEEMEETANGVRMILSKAGVYVKKAGAAAGSAKKEASGDKAARVSKADAIADLVTAIEAVGGEVDPAIVDKLTGKAAIYFAGIINSVGK